MECNAYAGMFLVVSRLLPASPTGQRLADTWSVAQWLLALVLLLLPAPALADPLQWYANPANGHEYALWDGSGTWIDAYNATPMGAHLVTFDSAAEENWVWNTFLPVLAPNPGVPPEHKYRFWIGFTDSEAYGATEGQWRWVTGEPVTYTNWGPGEPNNSSEGEDFAESIRPANFWNDLGPPAGTFTYTWQAIFERDTVPIGGSITGMSPTMGKVTCRNLTTKKAKTVKITLSEGMISWNCEQAGLVVNPGDTIKQTMTVTGPAD